MGVLSAKGRKGRLPASPRGRSLSRYLPQRLLDVLLVAGSLLTLMPFLWMLFTSFKPLPEVVKVPPTFFPEQPTLQNFAEVFRILPVLRLYLNSTIVSVVVVISVLLTSSLAGYTFAKVEFPFRRGLFLLVLSTTMIPFHASMIPLYLIVMRMRLLDTLTALILPFAVWTFGIFLMKQFSETIPDELLAAARIDGATEWQIWRFVVLPELRPALSTLGIFTFLHIWNEYLWPLIVVNSLDKRTLPIALAWFADARTARFDLIMAASALVVIPTLVVYFLFQKQIVEGIALSGMKM